MQGCYQLPIHEPFTRTVRFMTIRKSNVWIEFANDFQHCFSRTYGVSELKHTARFRGKKIDAKLKSLRCISDWCGQKRIGWVNFKASPKRLYFAFQLSWHRLIICFVGIFEYTFQRKMTDDDIDITNFNHKTMTKNQKIPISHYICMGTSLRGAL